MRPDLAEAIQLHAALDEAEMLGLDVDPEVADLERLDADLDALGRMYPERRAQVVAHMNDGWSLEIAAVLP